MVEKAWAKSSSLGAECEKAQAAPDNELVIGCAVLRSWPTFIQGRVVAVYNPVMAKDVIHISEADAASEFSSLMARVRAGAEVVIENDARPVAVLRSAEAHPGRLLSESIALAEAHGSTVTLDGEFAGDLEEIINSHREPLNPPAWD